MQNDNGGNEIDGLVQAFPVFAEADFPDVERTLSERDARQFVRDREVAVAGGSAWLHGADVVRGSVPARSKHDHPSTGSGQGHGVAEVTASGVEAAKAVLNYRTRDLLREGGGGMRFVGAEDGTDVERMLRAGGNGGG